MKTLIEFLVKAIVEHPEEVKIEEKESEAGTIISISASPNDIKLIIGRYGSTIRAIRTLARAKAIKEKKRVYLEIKEEKGSLFQKSPVPKLQKQPLSIQKSSRK